MENLKDLKDIRNSLERQLDNCKWIDNELAKRYDDVSETIENIEKGVDNNLVRLKQNFNLQ